MLICIRIWLNLLDCRLIFGHSRAQSIDTRRTHTRTFEMKRKTWANRMDLWPFVKLLWIKLLRIVKWNVRTTEIRDRRWSARIGVFDFKHKIIRKYMQRETCQNDGSKKNCQCTHHISRCDFVTSPSEIMICSAKFERVSVWLLFFFLRAFIESTPSNERLLFIHFVHAFFFFSFFFSRGSCFSLRIRDTRPNRIQHNCDTFT